MYPSNPIYPSNNTDPPTHSPAQSHIPTHPQVAGTSGKIQTDTSHDEDEGISTEAQAHAIVAALGTDRRNQVFARVYLARSDVSYAVRTASLHVWKSLVGNTPRTLTEIMPALMDLMIRALAADGVCVCVFVGDGWVGMC